MKKNPLVSTLICTYNAEKFISMTLDSVIGQTYKNQEILILDNGSKDNTVEIIKKYQEINVQIILFDLGKNLGAYPGLNYLLDRAKGEYIAIQDHDDIRHTQKLEKQVEFLEKNKKYIGCGTGTLMYYGKSKIGFTYDTKARETNTGVIHTSLVFRNEGFRYDLSNEFLCDGYFIKNILCLGFNRIYIIPDVLTLHYYKETGNNYSEQWFKFTKKNIQRYFDVYGYKIYYILLIFYIMFCKLLPSFLKQKLNIFLLYFFKRAKKKEFLIKDKYLKEILSYY